MSTCNFFFFFVGGGGGGGGHGGGGGRCGSQTFKNISFISS